jgi:hypothetical protein
MRFSCPPFKNQSLVDDIPSLRKPSNQSADHRGCIGERRARTQHADTVRLAGCEKAGRPISAMDTVKSALREIIPVNPLDARRVAI